MGSRGSIVFDIEVNLRNGAHHSGNWGGLIANPALILSNALSVIADKRGQIQIPEWRPKTLTNSVRMALADCEVDGGEEGPRVEQDWGEKPDTPRSECLDGIVLKSWLSQPEFPKDLLTQYLELQRQDVNCGL